MSAGGWLQIGVYVVFDPAKVTATAVGTMKLTFAHDILGTFAYTVNGVTQSKTITREVFAEFGTACH